MKALERNSNGNAESTHDCTDANIDQKEKMSKEKLKKKAVSTQTSCYIHSTD